MRNTLLVVLCALLTGACGLLPENTDGDAVVSFAPRDREPAPAIVAETLAGEQLALTDLDGPVVVNFWGSWCGPCRQEAPHLNAVAQTYADDGVTVVGVNGKDNLANARLFSDANLAFDSWFDPDQSIAAEFGRSGPVGFPTTLILDADHRVAVRFFGAVSGASLAPRLDAVLAESSGGGG